METTVAQFAVVEVGFLGHFARFFGHHVDFLAFFFRSIDFLEHDVGNIRILVHEIVEVFFQKIVDEFVDGGTVFGNILRAKFGFGLRLENRLFYLDTDGRNHPHTNVGVIVVLGEKFLDDARNRFAEHRLMRTAHGGVLAVHERITFFAVLVGMRKSHFDIVAFQMDDGIQRRSRHFIVEQVFQTVFRIEFLSVEDDSKPRVEIRIILQHRFHESFIVRIVDKQTVIGKKFHQGAARFGAGFDGRFFQQDAFFKFSHEGLVFTETLNTEIRRKRIHCLDTYPIQTHRLMECLAIVLGTGVHLGRSCHQFRQRNTTSVVAHRHITFLDVHFDNLTATHHEFVDTIVDNFLQQHIHTVFGLRSVAQTSDVHTGTQADMLVPV